jgi:glycosyltransferase involved in cell wall biosynthesis
MIEQVLMSVLMCCRDNSHIYPVIDGCTDRTEEIILKIANTFSGVPITPVYTSNVHELLSINAGLKAARQEGDAYNIVLQDDVILADFMLERKVESLYKWGGRGLGYVSFRLGANFSPDAATSKAVVPYVDYIENSYGHGIQEAKVIYPGYFAYRSVPIKSPVCIPSHIVRSIGIFNEKLAPYGHDDLEYSIRLIKSGYKNGVFPLRFFSDVKWGGTRTSPHPELNKTIARNMNMIRDMWRPVLDGIAHSIQGGEIVPVPNVIAEDEKTAQSAWIKSRNELIKYQRGDGLRAKIKAVMRIVQRKTITG